MMARKWVCVECSDDNMEVGLWVRVQCSMVAWKWVCANALMMAWKWVYAKCPDDGMEVGMCQVH